MMCKREASQRSIDPITPTRALHDGVRRALHVRRTRLHAVVVAAGIASVTPLALGAAFPPLIPLGSLYPANGGDGSRGFVLTGIHGDGAGRSVKSAGDVNGDGIDDLIIGAPYADAGADSTAGKAYVVFGSTQDFPALIPLGSLYPANGGDGSRGFVLPGSDAFDNAGFSVSGAGDVNGDGIDDVIIGAHDATHPRHGSAGESYVVFGSSQGFPAIMPLATLYPAGGGDGSHGFILTGIDAADHSGASVSGAGDLNGDGIDDLVIGAVFADAGESYVVFGSTQGFPAIMSLASLFPARGGDGSRGFVLIGSRTGDHLGVSVSAAGDVNGDGIDDLIVGAGENDASGEDAGASYVVFGSTQGFPAVMPLASLYPDNGGDGSRGFALMGIDRHDYAGNSVSAAGDVNGDGVDDLFIGAYRKVLGSDFVASESYVVFGSTQGFPAVVPLAKLYPAGGGDGSLGFVLKGINPNRSGISDQNRIQRFLLTAPVSGAGDVNDDGIDDLIIGAPFADPGGNFSAGQSYVVFGSAQGFPAIVPLASLFPARGGDGSGGFVLTGIDANNYSGCSVSSAGDVNADGVEDFVVGAYGTDAGREFTGESYVVFGRSVAP